MMDDFLKELTYRHRFKFQMICRTAILYGQDFLGWLALGEYRINKIQGTVCITLNTTDAEYCRINTLRWLSIHSLDLLHILQRYSQHESITEDEAVEYWEIIRTYNPEQEFVVMFLNDTHLFCTKVFGLWQGSNLDFPRIQQEAIADWISTFNSKLIKVEAQPIM